MTHNRFIRFLLGAATALTLAGPAPAVAADASAFFKPFEGKWRGGGSVKRSLKGKAIRIQCALELKLNEAGRKLENSGRCATTSGKGKVSGAISYGENGKLLTGAFLKQYANTRVLKSSGSYDDKAMTLNATHQDTNTDIVSRSRTIIEKPSGNSFVASIYEYDRKRSAFIRIGELVFKR